MRLCYLIILLFGMSAEAKADLSWFRKLVNLRFSPERTQSLVHGEASLADLKAGELVRLEGEVLLFPGHLLEPRYYTPEEWRHLVSELKPVVVPIQKSGLPFLTDLYKATQGTFALRLKDAPSGALGMFQGQRNHPAKAYLVSPQGAHLVYALGEPRQTPQDADLITNPHESEWYFEGADELMLLVHAASPPIKGLSSLTLSLLWIGDSATVRWTRMLWHHAMADIEGAFAALFIYYFFLFLFRKRELSLLYLALFALLSLGLCLLTVVEPMSNETFAKVFTATNLGSIGFLTLFLFSMIQKVAPSWAYKKWLRATLVLYSSAVLSFAFFPQIANPLFFACFVNTLPIIILATIQGIRHRSPGVLFLIIGVIISACFEFDLFLVMAQGPVEEINFQVVLGNLALAMALALVNAKEFSVTYEKAIEHDRLNQKLLTEIQAQEKARMLFFHNTSHELRTPLNGIIGFLDLVRKGHYGTIADTAAQQVSKALRLAESLKSQVNTILDLAKSKRGELQLNIQSISLRELKQDIDQLAEGLCLKSSLLSYSSELLSERDTFYGDRDKLFTILRNLLGNAFKFRIQDQSNRVSCQLKLDQNALIIEVSDTGIGIPEEFREKIFEDFGQVQSDARRSYEGTGLGLSMVRDLVTLMKGTITLDSEPGKGSRFTILIPESKEFSTQSTLDYSPMEVQMPSDGEALKSALPQNKVLKLEQSSEQPWNILVIDDNETNCEVIAAILQVDGYQTETSVSGRAGLDSMRKKRPDLLLLDMMMPEMSGEDVLASMRQETALHDIPVILITARASEEDRISGLKLGVDDYLPKPIFATELRLRVHNMLERHALVREIERYTSQGKMVQIGELFGELSHELKNILHGALGQEKLDLIDGQMATAVLSCRDGLKSEVAAAMISGVAASAQMERWNSLKLTQDEEHFTTLQRIKSHLVDIPLNLETLQEFWLYLKQMSEDELVYFQSLLKVFVQYGILSRQIRLCETLTQSVLQYSRQNTRDAQAHVPTSWQTCFELIQVRARKSQVRWNIELTDVTVAIAPSSLTQVLVNLILNALDAMQEQNTPDPWIHLQTHIETDVLILSCTNAGAPIESTLVDKLFVRGFSTKGDKGNGIGLYTSKRLLRDAGGSLIYVRESQHPCFVIKVPLFK